MNSFYELIHKNWHLENLTFRPLKVARSKISSGDGNMFDRPIETYDLAYGRLSQA